MDTDLDALTRDQLLAEVKKLRAGIRAHRDATGHDLAWPQFMEGCIRYRRSLDTQENP